MIINGIDEMIVRRVQARKLSFEFEKIGKIKPYGRIWHFSEH